MVLMYEDPGQLRDTMDLFVDLQSRWGVAQTKAAPTQSGWETVTPFPVCSLRLSISNLQRSLAGK
jgi:hypothetical protein